MLEYWDVAVNLGTMSLGHALGNPDDVTTLLFLQLDVRVKDAKVELLHEGILHELHLQESTRRRTDGRMY